MNETLNAFRKLLLVIFGLALTILFSYLSLTKGWGLEVKSWPWFIGCSFFGQMAARGIVELATAKDKKDKE
jgi:hypothetical protein